MKTLIVTSRVTFVPSNYNELILGLAASQHVSGLIVIDNLNFSLFKSAFGLILCGAWRMGLQLLVNIFSRSTSNRKKTYNAHGKTFSLVKDINSIETINIIQQANVDLIVNARTRSIYQKQLLNLPKLGCLNIHHGLLPQQRGILCDLWALSENLPAGFSIHYMNEKIDQGAIVKCVQVSDGNHKNFLEYLKISTKQELPSLISVLELLANGQALELISNEAEGVICRRQPRMRHLRAMKAVGMEL